jgi:hypothetical protein
MKEILKLTPEEGRCIIYEDIEGFKIIKQDIMGKSRWSIVYEIVIQRLSDNKFFKSFYSKGATEYQDQLPYEYEKAIFEEVVPVEKTITVYE